MSKQRSADDRLALIAVIVGAAVAFLALREPMLLGTGAALGLAGVLLALRGERPISGRAWLRAALSISLFALIAGVGIETYQEWIVGQWFAEGATSRAATDELRRMSETVSLLHVTALASSLVMLVGAVLNRLK